MQHTHQGQPCTTRECQEAALAAMRASAGNAGPSGTSGNAADLQKPGLEPLRAGGGGGAIRASAASPPATPGSASAFASAGGSGSLGSPPSPANTKGVRFSDEAERDNLHVGLPDSRSSSMDSLHRAYDEAAAARRPPPTASGFSVTHTAGGRLEAVSSSARWEDVVGYSRAVKRGPFIFVSGTSAVDQASGRVLYRRDAYKQTRLAFTIIERALATVGASLDDVVRTRIFVRNLQRDGEGISKAHGEFLKHVKPASTMVEVARLVHEDILVLIEVDAVLGEL